MTKGPIADNGVPDMCDLITEPPPLPTSGLFRIGTPIDKARLTVRLYGDSLDPASVGREQADAHTLLKWWRGHWGIENKVHWVRDETFGEDRCRVRCGFAPQALAAFRNVTMNWLRSQKIVNLAAALRQNAWNPQPLFATLGRWNN